MINNILQFVKHTLDLFLKQRFGLDESIVVLNNLIEESGSVPEINKNKVVISLINIERGPDLPNKQPNAPRSYTAIADESYKIDVLISSNFDDYTETLKFLDAAMQFFYANKNINPKAFPTIPDRIGALQFETEKVDYSQMHSLWGAMGAKYRPSVIYKISVVAKRTEETAEIKAIM